MTARPSANDAHESTSSEAGADPAATEHGADVVQEVPSPGEATVAVTENDAAPVEEAAGRPAVQVEAAQPPLAPVTASQTLPSESPKPWWQRAWAVLGAVVGIVGAVTGVISIVPLLVRDVTTPDSLAVTAESADAELAPVFAVPIGADWSDFPTSSGACSQEQQAWLDDVGTRLTERFMVSVGNRASEGATLSLKDFRGQGETASTSSEAVAVVCDRGGTGGSSMRAARVDPASGRTAVYAQADPSLPDNPLVFNLAPGESGDFALLVQSSADFTGDLVFTVSVGSESWTAVLPVDGGVSVPGLAAQRFTISEGGLACVGTEPCDPHEVLQDLMLASGKV
ncbi:hypothetical protein ACFWHT_01025 [Microbacterium sp. NPDC058342]|uniref:hypothetical protein n=1 Tax=Microbacterium sp. NPDC058342 TaxID=3346454 RepID=UPI003656FBA1